MIQALNGLRPFALPSMVARGRGSAPIWTPAANFPLGTEPGLWYDPSTFTGLYQDSAGSSPTTAVGQPNGLMLDRRLGATDKPELIPSNTTGWTIMGTATAALVGSEVVATADGSTASPGYWWAIPTVIGRPYFASASLRSPTGNTMWLATGNSSTFGARYASVSSFSGASSLKGLEFTATAATTYIFIGGSTSTVGHQYAASGLTVKHRPGNHISQATVPSRPIINAAGAIQYTTFDGLDDGMSTGAITLGSDMDCFIAVKRTSATGILLYTTSGGGVYLGALDATAGAASAGAGAPTYAVNGVDVAGGTGTTRTQLAAAIPIGSWAVLEIRNANLSAWAALAMGAYTGFPMGMNFAQGIVCPAGDAATRTKNRQFAGAKAGLSL